MNYTLSPKTFEVRELFNPQLKENGKYYYYILEKKGISHKEAAKRISANGVTAYFAGTETQSESREAKPTIWFCGIKDKNASTKQWFCTNEKIDEIDEPDFKTKFRGCSDERIFVGKHKGNNFSILVELDENEQKALSHFKAKNEFVCNYFGEQRFSENTIEIVNALSREDYEKALKLFLTKKSKFDSQKSRAMKKVIEENWGDWKKIMESEEIKTTRKVELFSFLETNPSNFKEAFSYAESESLKTTLKAAQAIRFNEELNKTAEQKKPNNIKTQITVSSTQQGADSVTSGLHGQTWNISASKAFPRKLIIQPTAFEEKFRKSYLERKTFFTAEKFRARRLGGKKFELMFELGKGSYATVFLKFLESWLKNKVNKGKSPN
jgi:tRNA pseudouridine13 synthase